MIARLNPLLTLLVNSINAPGGKCLREYFACIYI